MSQAKADQYAARLTSAYDFESVCVAARHHYCLREMSALPRGRVLEIGCGAELLAARVIAAEVDFDSWTIVEPAQKFAKLARELAKGEARIDVIEAAIEDIAPDGFAPCDILIVSGVLHEVEDAQGLMRASLRFARSAGAVIVTAPNAHSFHRLLAREMKLIADPHELSDRNRLLAQPRVFDRESLRALLESVGVRDLKFDGYLFKPFTHAQMWSLPFLREPLLLDGLDRLGRLFPDNAAEIAFHGKAP